MKNTWKKMSEEKPKNNQKIEVKFNATFFNSALGQTAEQTDVFWRGLEAKDE